MEKLFDVVLYGATGFTGRQTAKYFAEHAGPDVKWAIAGRNKEKLEKIRDGLGGQFKDLPLITADISDQESIDKMVSSTKVLLTTVGPYSLYGEPVVEACIKFKTDYVDITGETLFIKKMIGRFHEEAKSKGIKIIPFCGFDSVPSDLGTLMVTDYIKNELKQDTREVKAFFKAAGGFNGGTLATLFNMAESGDLKELEDPEIINPPEYRHPGLEFPDDNQPLYYDKDLQAWTAPFFMAPVNTRVVRRSNALLEEEGKAYGKDFSYIERMYFDEIIPVKASLVTVGTMLSNSADKAPWLMEQVKKRMPKPGEGPSEKTMDNGFFKTWLIGKAEDGTRVKAFVYSKGDPGNRVTVKILCESALSLAQQRNELPGGNEKGGILTPATGLGHILLERLKKKGMTFEIKRTF